MKNEFKPQSLDLPAFAEESGTLAGSLPLLALERLKESLHPDASKPAPMANWQANGELRPVTGGADQTWLNLEVQALVPLECQRCLETVETPIHVSRQFRFASDEETAAALDEEEEDDVLVISHRFDLLELIEDELLLELPVVPRHDECPRPLPQSTRPGIDADDTDEPENPHPFAKLAALKTNRKDGNDDH